MMNALTSTVTSSNRTGNLMFALPSTLPFWPLAMGPSTLTFVGIFKSLGRMGPLLTGWSAKHLRSASSVIFKPRPASRETSSHSRRASSRRASACFDTPLETCFTPSRAHFIEMLRQPRLRWVSFFFFRVSGSG